MQSTSGSHGWTDPEGPAGGFPTTDWRETIDLLRLVQDDYVGARKQLEIVSQNLAEREALVNERLQQALLESTGHRTMCLVSYHAGVGGSALGKATLGTYIHKPISLPKKNHLEVRCLGRFSLSYDGKTINKWQSVRAKALFQYLMTRPREPVVKDILMEALWPGCDPQSANNSLKAAVHGLRQTLGQLPGNQDTALVVFVQGSYQLSPDVDLWLDVEEFEQHWTTGRRLEREGRLSEAILEFESAQALYGGDYLQDELYEEWTMLRREAFRDTYVAIVSKLASYALAADDHETCIIYCQKMLGKDSCREDAYRWLMRCYSRLGQRNRALRWYEICRRTVKTELEATPDRETEELYQSLLGNKTI